MPRLPLKPIPRRASKRTREKVVSSNVKEMVDTWKKTGHIGNSKPKTKKKAVQQAVAAALSEADRQRSRTRKKAKRRGRT